MPDQSASPADERPWWALSPIIPFLEMSPEQEGYLRRRYGGMPPRMTLDDQGVALSMDDTLRVREQALYSAAVATELGSGQFPDEDAEKIVEVAKRFEKFIRTGE